MPFVLCLKIQMVNDKRDTCVQFSVGGTKMKRIGYKHTVAASFTAFVVQAVVNNFAPLLFLTFQAQYGIELSKITVLITANFFIQIFVDLTAVLFVDRIGYRASTVLAHAMCATGLIFMTILPEILPSAFAGLLISVFCYAVGAGLLDITINPIVNSCPSTNSNQLLCLLHSFYCWGQMGVVLLSTLFFTVFGIANWKALALVDSFTVVAKGRTAAQMWVWPNSYFRLIYIHALYQKTLLFVVNRQFRSAANDRKSIRLLHKMKEQEHWYAFSNISYNFLPQLIYRAIDTGLDIATEREQLHRHLEQEAERLEKNSERRLAGLILFLTMLTVCSATYDGASLVKDYFGWESGTTPFRIFAALLLSAIVITSISVWHYRRNKS